MFVCVYVLVFKSSVYPAVIEVFCWVSWIICGLGAVMRVYLICSFWCLLHGIVLFVFFLSFFFLFLNKTTVVIVLLMKSE